MEKTPVLAVLWGDCSSGFRSPVFISCAGFNPSFLNKWLFFLSAIYTLLVLFFFFFLTLFPCISIRFGKMGFLSTILGIFGFVFGIPIGILIGYFVFIRFESDDVKDPIIRPLHEYGSKTLQALTPEIPLWVKCPDYDRVDWLNKFILDMWPYLNKAICATIRSMSKPIFDEYIGKYHIESIEFGNLTLGTLPPTIQGMKVYDTQEKELVLEPALRWAGNPNISVVLKVLSLPLKLQLLDLQIFISPRIIMKPLVPIFPCFANITMTLLEKPYVDFGLKLLGGDIMAIPGLYRFVQETIKEQVANLYLWPKTLEVPILDGSRGAMKKPVGILHVKIIRAMSLLKMDILGKSDPYVKLKLSGEILPAKKTTVKMSNLNPEWNENFKFTVKDPETQVLQLHLYDWEKVGEHDKLGMQVVPLKLLAPHETKVFTLDVLKSMDPDDAHNKKSRGKIMVELTFVPFKEDGDRLSGSSDGDGQEIGAETTPKNSAAKGGLLWVMVEGAEDVEGKHHTNPYALIHFRGEKKKTKVIKKTRDPKWNAEFQFMLEEAPINDKILIEVMSKRRGFNLRSKESLGLVDINLTDVVNNERINEKYNLINSKNGVIHLQLEWRTV